MLGVVDWSRGAHILTLICSASDDRETQSQHGGIEAWRRPTKQRSAVCFNLEQSIPEDPLNLEVALLGHLIWNRTKQQ
jgi:hypothetical protein